MCTYSIMVASPNLVIRIEAAQSAKTLDYDL